MNKYPDYVNKFRPKGTIIKFVNNTYYVYEATSKRVKGKSYPVQIVKGIIGKIDENGFHKRETINIKDEAVIKEYGFTNYLLLFKDDFYHDVNSNFHVKDRLIILYSMICYLSSNSYLNDNKEIKIYPIEELIKTYNLSLTRQINAIERITGHKIEELEELKYICKVYISNQEITCKINNKQKELLDRLGVNIDELK